MTEAKKGRQSWRPAKRLSIRGQTPGFRLRWANKDPANIQKKLAEGWVPANKTNGINVEQEFPGLVHDGSPLSGCPEYRDAVLMALPEETAQERTAYFAEQSAKQIRAVKDRAQAENDANARKYGARPTSLRGGELVIR